MPYTRVANEYDDHICEKRKTEIIEATFRSTRQWLLLFSLSFRFFLHIVYMHISLVPPNPPQPLSLAVMSAMLEIWYTTLTYLIYRGKCRNLYRVCCPFFIELNLTNIELTTLRSLWNWFRIIFNFLINFTK